MLQFWNYFRNYRNSAEIQKKDNSGPSNLPNEGMEQGSLLIPNHTPLWIFLRTAAHIAVRISTMSGSEASGNSHYRFEGGIIDTFSVVAFVQIVPFSTPN